MENKPVLLLGLGGAGCEIASRIYKELPESERKRVVVHTFDTNINDILKLGLKNSDITVTSSEYTVEQCLLDEKIRKSNVTEWFPNESPTILRTKFSDGAGQIRAISRLAYMQVMGNPEKLMDLEKKLQTFSQVDGLDYANDVRVMIVCSIAGGTGSGIFLQTALYLKDYFKSKGKNVTIRGSFVLPDIFVKNNIINGVNTINVRANGYACLKELDAIIKSTMGQDDENNINIQLAYKPGMADEKVTTNPYDFVFLYDYENLDGQHLGEYQHYLDQISKVIYLQLFSDIARETDSDEINTLRNIVENDGRARYASAGVSTLIYPYKDIVDYSSYRIASENIGKNWLKLDDLYRHEVEEIENYKKQGIFREVPKKYIRINELFENEIKNNNVFFKHLERSLYEINAEGELGDKKVKLLIENINKRVEDDVTESKEYKEFSRYSGPQVERLNSKPDEMKNEVENFETILIRFKKAVNNGIEDKKSIISSDILPLHLIEPKDMAKFPYQPMYWILGVKDGQALHPIASRSFLYELKTILLEKIGVLSEETSDLYSSIERYNKDFEQGRSASEVASEKVNNSSGFFSMFKKDWKVFGNEYNEKASKQMKRLKSYYEKKVLLGVYEELRKSVDDIIENDEERFFSALNEIITDFSQKYDSLSKMHEEKTDVTKVFVLATKELKDKLYQSLVININVEDALNTSYGDIICEKYNRFIVRKKNEYSRQSQNIKDSYKNRILDSYRNKIVNSQILDMNIIEALRKENELLGNDYSSQREFIEQQVRNTKNRAKPFALKSGANKLNLWGLNPEILETLSDDEARDLFENKSIVKSNGFSKYEIIRYVSMHGLKAQDFDKFSSGDYSINKEPGDYFLAYKESVDKLTKNEKTVTPHLDKRWHLINYMPDINDGQAAQDKRKITVQFIKGLLYGFIISRKKEDRSIWVFKDKYGNVQEIKNGDRDLEAKYPVLLTGLGSNPFIIDSIKNRVAEMKNRDFDVFSRELEKHEFMCLLTKGHPNLIDILIEYVNDCGRSKEAEGKIKIIEILDNFLDEVVEYMTNYYGSSRKRTALEVAIKYMYTMLNSSDKYEKSDKEVDYIQEISAKIETKCRSVIEENRLDISLDLNKDMNYEKLIEFINNRD